MLNVIDKDHFEAVKKFAEENGLAEKLQEQLDYLDTYAEHGDRGKTRCDLYKDFADQSFYFVMYRRGNEEEVNRWFNGGLIFFQGSESGVGLPQLSVTLSGRSDSRWEVHT